MQPPERAAFLLPAFGAVDMTRDELVVIVRRNKSTTLMARRLREALGIPQPRVKRGRVHDLDAKRRKYKGARHLMRQRYGVDLR